MADIKASALPVGSVVATAKHVYLKTKPGPHGFPWESNRSNGPFTDGEIQDFLDDDATMLREGA